MLRTSLVVWVILRVVNDVSEGSTSIDAITLI